MTINLDGYHLSIDELVKAARTGYGAALTGSARDALEKAHGWVQAIRARGQPVYGVNTGFGMFSDRVIPDDEIARLNRNLILSHAVGTGPDLPVEVSRAALLVRANTLAKGFSGARPVLVETLLDMHNRAVIPLVPSQGSLGSSGDLAPLAHMALVFTRGEDESAAESGRALYDGKEYNGLDVMRMAGLERLHLEAKEGLAITNGASFSAAVAALAVFDLDLLVGNAGVALALSMEALRGCTDAFDSRIHLARGQPGQVKSAHLFRELLNGSNMVDSTGQVQDAYSLRCAPQVHGAVVDTFEFISGVVQRELNAATDNPLIFAPGEALSGGNFHGEPVGMAMDYLGIAAAELGAISERRIYRLTDPALNGGLPAMLVDSDEAGGLNSGLMMPQYTAVALVLENRTLASPDSVNSLPTSGGQEDHNANAMTAALHARQILANLAYILAVEIYTAARAIYLRRRADPALLPGIKTSRVYELLMDLVPYEPLDTLWGPQIDLVKKSILAGELAAAAGIQKP